MSEALSVRAFALKLGVSHVAVLKAIKHGRLRTSIRGNAKGHSEIVDFDLARQEWEANANRPTKSNPQPVVTAPVTTVTTPPVQPAAIDVRPALEIIGEGGPLHATNLTDAQRLLTLERLRRQRLDIERDMGRLVLRSDVARILYEGDKILRENILNLPARLAGTLAATTDAGQVYQLLDAGLREALSAVASKYQEKASEADLAVAHG